MEIWAKETVIIFNILSSTSDLAMAQVKCLQTVLAIVTSHAKFR